MNFLKGAGVDTGAIGKQIGGQVKAVAMQAGSAILMKIFNHFTGGQTNGQGKPAMDLSKLLNFASVTGITDNKLGTGDITDIFKQISGGGGGGGGKPSGFSISGPAKDDGGDIDFDQFQDGMRKMAEKKYEDEGGSSDDKLAKLEGLIIQDADAFLKE